MRVVVSGATGTIGRALVKELVARGDEVTALSRDPEAAREKLGVDAARWGDPQSEPAPVDALRGSRRRGAPAGRARGPALVRRRQARDPRLPRARHAQPGGRACESCPRRSARARSCPSPPPACTGPGATSGWTRRSRRRGDFLAEVTEAWEAEARAAEELGVRVAVTRTGVVLSESGGALEKMLPPFKLGVGGPVAGGHQYVPWIHLDDVVGAHPLRARHARRLGSAEPDRPGAGDQQRAVHRARTRAPPAGDRPRARPGGEAALRRHGVDRDHGRACRSPPPSGPGLPVPAPGPGGRAARRHGPVLEPVRSAARRTRPARPPRCCA